ncbi:glycosyltransferase family 39 protein [Candidatus Pacearchaeota archaeon]|nr:glycosyltransferase family 39 protein [Candidatus Pacearchaeota archaeon]
MIKKILTNSFLQLCVIYSVLIAVMYFGVISRYALHFQIFALIIALLGIFAISEYKEKEISKKVHYILFVLAILIIIILRVIPYLNSNIPLGYDAGIYKYALEYGLERNDSWIVTGPTMEPAFLYLMEPLKLFFNADFIIKWIFILSIVVLGLALYWCTKLYLGKTPALISLLFYSVSVTQFLTFTFMYFRNVLGLALMLFSIGFLKRYQTTNKRKHLYLFIIFGGILGAVHRPTFYLFGLSYFFYTFGPGWRKRYDFKKYFAYVLYGIIILLIAVSFYIGRFWPAITTIIEPVASSFVDAGESPGTFISFKQYQFLTLAYFTFALIGIFSLLKKRKFDFLVIWALINASIVYFQLFFFNRFIIHLDIILLMFVGLGFSLVIQEKKWVGVGILSLLFISSSYIITKESIGAKNQIITEDDLYLIRELSALTEHNSMIMSFSKEYSPWILAYSNRTIIAPGLFDENKWNEAEWNIFWRGADSEKTIELMSRYDTNRPIYLYTGTKSFNNTCFNQFLEENGRNVYEYNC